MVGWEKGGGCLPQLCIVTSAPGAVNFQDELGDLKGLQMLQAVGVPFAQTLHAFHCSIWPSVGQDCGSRLAKIVLAVYANFPASR